MHGPVDGLLQVMCAGRVERAGPVPQAQRAAANPVQADHRNGTPYREHRAVAGDLRAAHLRTVDAAQQLKTQCRVAQHDLGQFLGVLALHQRQTCRTRRAARQRGQGADLAHALEQLFMRIHTLAGVGFEPAFECARQRACVAVALARLAVRGAVGNGAQGLGHQARQVPGQAQGLSSEGRQLRDHASDVGLLERRRARQQPVQGNGHRQHIALCIVA